MRRILILSLIAYTLLLTGLFTLNGELVALAFPFILYLVFGVLLAPGQLDLVFERSLSAERVGPGSPVEVSVRVTNQGATLPNLLVQDILSPNLVVTEGAARHLLSLGKGQTASWKYTVRGQRGYYAFTSIQAEARDQFGLLRQKQVFATEGQVLVLPPVQKLKRVAIRTRRTRVYSGEIPARTGGLGVEFFGLREYQPGDSPHWINWRASARHPGQLFSNEFEQERVADVGIILDGRTRSNTIAQGLSLFEYSVQAAATLSTAFLAQGDRVSLLHYGLYLQWTLPGYGKIQRERILRALTQVEAGESLVFSYLKYIPTQLFPPQSQIVLISPLLPDDPEVLIQLRARGYQVLVISPDPISYELSKLPDHPSMQQAGRVMRIERRLLLQQLARSGIRTLDWDVSLPFDQVAQTLSRSPITFRTTEPSR